MSRETRVALPLLPQLRKPLETCGYCPKLCRGTCPVSNVEAREALIPWGKMSAAWHVARGDRPTDTDVAATAWGCSGCHACTSFCEHANPVASTLYAARAQYREAGVAPPRVTEAERRHGLRVAEAGNALGELAREAGVRPDAPNALLVGCAYLRKARHEARAILRSTIALLGPVRLVPGCCGAPLLHAGDRAGFEASRLRLADATHGARRFVIGDPGCALALDDRRAQTFVEVVAEHAERLVRVDALASATQVRFHDPCALGRGLGLYAAPRRVLERALARAAGEFDAQRERAECSGGGALLPIAMPQTSLEIAQRRLAEHRRLGAGILVTACASSLHRFRTAGEHAIDISSIVEQSLNLPA